MTKTTVTVKHDPEGHIRTGKPAFLLTLERKWITWTGIKDEAAFEAINDLSGDLFLNLRKLTSQLCGECENRKLPEDFKEMIKTRIDETWRDIIEKQKVGLDKLSILVRSRLDEKGGKNVQEQTNDEPVESPSAGTESDGKGAAESKSAPVPTTDGTEGTKAPATA